MLVPLGFAWTDERLQPPSSVYLSINLSINLSIPRVLTLVYYIYIKPKLKRRMA